MVAPKQSSYPVIRYRGQTLSNHAASSDPSSTSTRTRLSKGSREYYKCNETGYEKGCFKGSKKKRDASSNVQKYSSDQGTKCTRRLLFGKIQIAFFHVDEPTVAFTHEVASQYMKEEDIPKSHHQAEEHSICPRASRWLSPNPKEQLPKIPIRSKESFFAGYAPLDIAPNYPVGIEGLDIKL